MAVLPEQVVRRGNSSVEQGPHTPLATGGSHLVADLRQVKWAVIAASLSSFCLGYDTGIIAGAMTFIQEDPDFAPVTPLAKGFIVSSTLAGATFGAICGMAADIVGRRRILLLVATLFLLSPLGMAVSPNLYALVIARACAGLAVGTCSGLANLYISEVAPAECRGQLGGWAPFLGTTGILVSYITSTVLGLAPHGLWRVQLGLGAVPALLLLLLQGKLPETPRWLLTQRKHAEAEAAMKALFPLADHEDVEVELHRIEADLNTTAARRKVGLCGLWGEFRKPTLIGISINVLQQVSGINVVIYFGPSILQQAGFGSTGAMVVTASVSLVQLFATAALIRLVDRVGRRPLALLGIVLMMCGLALLIASFLAEQVREENKTWAAWVSVAGMLVFRAAFSMSLGPLPYIMTSEFFVQEARAAGVAMCWASNWGANFAVSLTFPLAAKALPGNGGIASILGIYTGFCAVAFLFVQHMLPETRGLRLEDLSRNHQSSDVATPACT